MARYEAAAKFLSTPSARRATRWPRTCCSRALYFYPRPPRGGRPAAVGAVPDAQRISIHALREEGDPPDRRRSASVSHFYPRPPRGGRRFMLSLPVVAKTFLSTPSARRATYDRHRRNNSGTNFYPRPPRGGRPAFQLLAVRLVPISIHALREEGDVAAASARQHGLQFLSTPSARRATTLSQMTSLLTLFLSTPSARRATTAQRRIEEVREYFYPRPPRGGRHPEGGLISCSTRFLSTPSARRATSGLDALRQILVISIHALREEGDMLIVLFYRPFQISIHALREEGDRSA